MIQMFAIAAARTGRSLRARSVQCATTARRQGINASQLREKTSNPADKKLVWEDIQLVMKELGLAPAKSTKPRA